MFFLGSYEVRPRLAILCLILLGLSVYAGLQAFSGSPSSAADLGQARRLTLPTGESATIRGRLEVRRCVAGKRKCRIQPYAYQNVSAVPSSGGAASYVGSDAAGRFSLRVVAGSYTLELSASPNTRTVVDVRPHETASVTLTMTQ